MNTAATCAKDFYEILANKDDFIGRDLQVSELGMVYRDPIQDIRLTTSNRVIIKLEWLARKSSAKNQDDWRLASRGSYDYEAPCDTIRRLENGSIEIKVPLAWRGVVQTADAPRLSKPMVTTAQKV